MAAFSHRCPAWFITFVFSLLTVSVCFSLEQCVDGTYEHEGKTCCKCAAGQYLVEDCTKDPTDRKCEDCKQGTYRSHPNNQKSLCDRCTSCSHPNDNLEEEEACTRARDTKCRCIKDHYCVSGKEICKLCQPCKTCDNGVKIPCQGHNDTVCKDKGNNEGVIAGVAVVLILAGVAAVGVFLYCWKKGRCDQKPPQENGDAVAVEMEPLHVPKDVDLQPHLPDIAELIGIKVMKEIAMRSNISNTTIDSVHQNNPRDAQEQTLELLKIYVEHQGKEAAKNLIKVLQISKHKDTAEKVARLLTASTQ